MLQILLLLIATFFNAISFGVFTTHLLKISFTNPIKYLFFGFFGITIIISVWHFFLPINQLSFFLILACSILIYLLKERHAINAIFKEIYTLIILNKWVFIPTAILTIYLSSLTSIFYDEGLYHAGFINWMNKFPIVPGLANLHFRLGFNSNWHLLSALFNGYHIFSTTSNSLNATLILAFTIYFLFEQSSTNKVAAILLYFPLLIIYYLIAPSPDLAVCFFGLAFILSLFNHEQSANKDSFWFYALPFLITVKINAATLFLFFMLYVYYSWSNYKELKKQTVGYLVFLFLLMGGWLGSNLLLSGYLIFPYLPIEALHLKWAVPEMEKIVIINGIKYTPLTKWTGISLEEAAKLSKLQQLILWFKSVRIVEKLVIIGFLFSSATLIFITRKSKAKLLIALAILISLVANIILVPDLRFFAGIGFAGIACLVSYVSFRTRIINSQTIVTIAIISQIAITGVLYTHLYPKIINSPLKSVWSPIFKQPYSYVKFDTSKIDGASIYIPKGSEFSWDVTPSTLAADSSIHLLGEDVKDGFYK